jgi:hypothetical protein
MTIAEAEKKIKIAWIVGIISGFVTLIFTLVVATSAGGTVEVQGITVSLWMFLDIFLIFLFTFGIYMKSRVAAVGMFIYALISKLIMWGAGFSAAGAPALPGVVLGIAILYLYFEGARGAIAYHQLRAEDVPANPSVAVPED